MSEAFPIPAGEFDEPPAFAEAVRLAVERFEAAAARFDDLRRRLSEEGFTDEEWRVVELTAEDLVTALERAEEGYVAVQYDSHAWYRVMESLETLCLRLESAAGLMERALERASGCA